jgi:predicted transcriptional regulator
LLYDWVKYLRDVFKKNAPPESNEQVDNLQIDESPDTSGVLDLLLSLQEMSTKEQKLLEVKRRLMETQQDLQSKLIKKIEKKKTAVNDLISQIENLQNTSKQLSEALGANSCPLSY